MDFGTFIIGFFGYGFTLLVGGGSLIAFKDFFRAHRAGNEALATEEFKLFVLGGAIAIVSAALTRWLVGGSI